MRAGGDSPGPPTATGCCTRWASERPATRPPLDVDAVWYPLALPTYGGGDAYLAGAPAGDPSRRHAHHPARGRRGDPRSRRTTASTSWSRSRDELVDLTVELHVRTHPRSAVLEQWVEIVHDQPGPGAPARLRLDRTAAAGRTTTPSSCSSAAAAGPTSGAGPPSRCTRAPPRSPASVALQPHLQRSPVRAAVALRPVGPRPRARCSALSVAWGGNTRIDLDVRPSAEPGAPRQLRLRAGANPYAADYVLDPVPALRHPDRRLDLVGGGSARRSPGASTTGPGPACCATRNVCVRSWPTTGRPRSSRSTRTRISGLIRRAADARRRPVPARRRVVRHHPPARRRHHEPGRLGRRSRASSPTVWRRWRTAAADAGIRFGIWVEPEMVNPRQRPVRARTPTGCCATGATPRLHRNQLVLDTLRPEVREFAAGRGRPRPRRTTPASAT